MILINLLPHREEARQRAKESFYAKLGLSAIAGVIVSIVIWAVLFTLEEDQLSANSVLVAENAALEKDVKAIEEAQDMIRSLEARKKAVEDLQSDRNLSVRWLEDFARLTPEGVYITKIVQNGTTLQVEGIALGIEHISQFLENTKRNNMQTVTNSSLNGREVKEGLLGDDKQATTPKVYFFSLDFKLMREEDLKLLIEENISRANKVENNASTS